MKISTRGRYAVAMADMAQVTKNGAEGPVSLSDISERQEFLSIIWSKYSAICDAPVWWKAPWQSRWLFAGCAFEAIRIGDVIRASMSRWK